MNQLDQIYEVLVGAKTFEDGAWHVFDASGAELTDHAGVLWRAIPGALLMWPHAPEEFLAGLGGGGGSQGAQAGKRLTSLFPKNFRLPAANEFDDEEHIRAEIIREDEEILMVIMSAVTSGAMTWVH